MKRFLVFVLFTVCLAKPSFGQKNKLRVYFNTVQFYAPEIGNYVELHFQFDAKSLKFATSPEGIQSKIYLSIEIKDSLQKIHFRDEYALNSPYSSTALQKICTNSDVFLCRPESIKST